MSKPRRCVLLTLDYPPERGGVARYLGNLVRVSQGGIASVYVPEEHACEGPGVVQAVPLFWPLWPHWLPVISFLRKREQEVPTTVLISQALPLGTAAWIASFFGGPEYSILLHGLDLRLALRSARKKWLLARQLQKARAVFTNSRFVAEEVHQAFPSVTPVVVLPGVEPQSFPSREAARQQCGVQEGVFQILAVTRLVPRKGIDVLLEALTDLPSSVHLTIIGSGMDEARLREKAASLGERVRFETHVEDVARNAWYAAADVFVLPTRDEGTDVEGFGIVFLEAGLASLPVIAGLGGGVTEAVRQDETGLLVDPRNPQAIAQAIERLRTDPVFARRLGEQGRLRAQTEFRWEDRWQLIAKTLQL